MPHQHVEARAERAEHGPGKRRRAAEGRVEERVLREDEPPATTVAHAVDPAHDEGPAQRSVAVPRAHHDRAPGDEGREALEVRVEGSTALPLWPLAAAPADVPMKLAEAETRMRQRILRDHMLAGVTITDPASTYIDATVRLAQDVTVLPNGFLRGNTAVGENSVIGPATTAPWRAVTSRRSMGQ